MNVDHPVYRCVDETSCSWLQMADGETLKLWPTNNFQVMAWIFSYGTTVIMSLLYNHAYSFFTCVMTSYNYNIPSFTG